MTIFHLANCVALGFAPYYIFYESILKEHGGKLEYFYIVFAYLVTGGVRLLTEGMIPSFIGQNLFRELLVALIAGLDFVVLWLFLSRRSNFMSIGFAWSLMESLATRFVPIWVGAKGYEFDSTYLRLAFDCNLSLVYFLSITCLIFLLSKRRESLPNVSLLYAVLIFALLVQPFITILNNAPSVSIFGLLFFSPGFIFKTIWIVLLAYFAKSTLSSPTAVDSSNKNK